MIDSLHSAAPVSDRGRAAQISAAGLLALAVAMGIGRFAFTPLLPMMQQDNGVSVAAGAWLASANYGGYLLGAASAVCIRVRAERAIRLSLVVIALATLGMGLVHSFPAWIVLRAIAGIASAWVLIHASAWCLERLDASHRPILSGVVFGGVGAGVAVAGAICIALMYAGVGAAQAWIIFGIVALLVSTAIWSTFGETRAMHRASARSANNDYRWDRESVRLVLCYGAFGFSYIVPATFLPLMARQTISDPLIFGWSWPIFGVAALASTLAAAMLQGSITHRRLWITSHGIMALGVVLPVLSPGIIAIMIAALLVGGTFMVTTMAAIGAARDIAGQRAAVLIAAMTAAFAIGQIAGPVCVSYVAADGAGFSTVLLVAGMLLVTSAYALSRGGRAKPAPDLSKSLLFGDD